MTKKAKRTLKMAKATSTRRGKRKNVHEQIAAGRKKHGLQGKPNGAIVEPKKSRRKRAEPESFTPDQPVELGPLTIPEGKDAERALLQIAQANDAAIQAKKASDEQGEKAKRAKKKYEDAMSEVHRLVKLFTHPSDMPLFRDLDQREKDQAEMEAAAATGGEVEVQ